MKVSLFITCLSDVFFPEVGKSVVEVLERLGVEVDFPEAQTCCGQPAYNSGYHREAKEAAKKLIEAFASSEYVVSPSGSCVSMIRHYYPKLFADDLFNCVDTIDNEGLSADTDKRVHIFPDDIRRDAPEGGKIRKRNRGRLIFQYVG